MVTGGDETPVGRPIPVTPRPSLATLQRRDLFAVRLQQVESHHLIRPGGDDAQPLIIGRPIDIAIVASAGRRVGHVAQLDRLITAIGFHDVDGGDAQRRELAALSPRAHEGNPTPVGR